jgi:uncharacterized protein YlaI
MLRKKRKDKKCIFCGKKGAKYSADPFRQELYNENRRMWICDDCYAERIQEI